jgi:hypothetical protein
LRERITDMQVMIEGQSHFQPFGLPYWGFTDLNKGVGSMIASYDYHIGVDYPQKTETRVAQIPAFGLQQRLCSACRPLTP